MKIALIIGGVVLLGAVWLVGDVVIISLGVAYTGSDVAMFEQIGLAIPSADSLVIGVWGYFVIALMLVLWNVVWFYSLGLRPSSIRW